MQNWAKKLFELPFEKANIEFEELYGYLII